MSNEPKKLEYPITQNYSPEVPIEVVGIRENTKLVAIVDTGFTGFLQIPLSVGIASNLRLWGSGRAKLADGSIVNNLECVGEIVFAGKKLFNIISLSESGNDCLLGMQFLNELEMDFVTSPKDGKAIFIDRKAEKPTQQALPVQPTTPVPTPAPTTSATKEAPTLLSKKG